MSVKELPIERSLPELKDALRTGTEAVLVAAPGAGKTTRVPLALLEEPWLAGSKIVMLEPRRMAARTAAAYMARQLGEQVGETVGYRVRMDSRTGPTTRIEVVTEGVLTRMLQADPSLEGIGLVIFDEFHERNLHADLGLALCLETRSLFRADLRLLVMSATMDAEPVAALLGGAAIVESEGRQFAVDTLYMPSHGKDEPLERHTARVVEQALREAAGDVLVFLPGEREIRRVQGELKRRAIGSGHEDVRILALYGSLPLQEQEKALEPAEAGVRKIVLSTTIAETSLTVEGVRIVIDCGLMRIPRFSPRTGMSRLETVRVARASADQRRGRAGRTAPGVCYRMWSIEEDRQLEPHRCPEIEEVDLSPLLLELRVWGANQPRHMPFLTPPPEPALRQAEELLTLLGALDEEGRLTEHGRSLAETPLHPRLAHMTVKAIEKGQETGLLACELAAVLGGRDPLRAGFGYGIGPVSADISVDLSDRIHALREFRSPHSHSYDTDDAALRLARQEAQQLKRRFGLPARLSAASIDEQLGLLTAYAYPDRIAWKRTEGASLSGGETYVLSGGRGAVLPKRQPLSMLPLLAAAELEDTGTDSRIRLAAAVSLELLEAELPQLFRKENKVYWDRESQSIRARIVECLGMAVLKERPLSASGLRDAELAAAWKEALRVEGLSILPWSKSSKQLRERMAFLHQADASWPDVSDEALLASADEWLIPQLSGIHSRGGLQRLNLHQLLEQLLPWDKRRMLDEEAPAVLTVPSGSRIMIDYSDPAAPVLAVRLQELFGLTQSPRIGFGRVAITLHLLSPANRPVQVTRDLESFWRDTYFEVKKDLKGRYPKHYWPDDPRQAVPTSRVRPRQS